MRRIRTYVLSIALLLPQIALAGVSLTRVDIERSDRAVFYFSERIPKHQTKLTEDKKNVKLTFFANSIVDSARSKKSDGVLTNVYAQTLNKKIECDALLREPRGYTTLSLPWSRSVILDVFEWNRLTEAEDAYRTALLALEENLPEAAKPDLLKAARNGHGEAAYVLGALLLLEGKANSAQEILKYAERAGATFADVAAARAQAFQMVGLSDSASRYSSLFMSISRGLPYQPIAAASLSEKPGEITVSTNGWAEVSTPKTTAGASSTKDTAFQTQFKGLFSDTASRPIERHSAQSLFDRFPLWLQATLAISLAIFLFIVWRYLKWRNAQLAIKIEENKKLNDIRLSEARAGAAEVNKKAAEAYKNKGKIIDKAIKDERSEEKNQSSSSIEQGELENLIRLYGGGAPARQAARPEPIKPNGSNAAEPPTEPKKERNNPKTELAQRLALEQQKLKSRKLTELAKSDLPGDEKKRRNIAKELGVELSSVEIKNALDKISDDKDRLAKLAQKFKNK